VARREDFDMASKHVLSLGQCSADQPVISRLLYDEFGAVTTAAHTPREALDELRRRDYALVLVNRRLNAGGSGLDFIDRLKADESLRAVPVMLVSNYDDAQRQAVEHGALPGFGKDALDDPQTLERLAAVLAPSETTREVAGPKEAAPPASR